MLVAFFKYLGQTIKVYSDEEDYQVMRPDGSSQWFSIWGGDKLTSLNRAINRTYPDVNLSDVVYIQGV